MDTKNFNPRPNFSELEENVLKFWEDNQIFKLSLKKTQDREHFVFFEGPPTANGKPALHHVEARAFKDLIPRFQTMRGKYVLRKAGWDTHGLPVEIQVEKTLGISGKKQIESIKETPRESIIEFNRLCKESVWQYKEEWEALTRRMGYWVDLENPYITYHNSYIESIWSIVKKIDEKGFLYKGHKVVPYCTRCGTALSSHEVAQGYKTVKDNSVYIKFKVESLKSKVENETYILSWTTTPWTLPGNIALAVGQDIKYSKVKVGSEVWILASERLSVVKEKFEIVEEVSGSDLVGLEYEPLFDVEFLKSEKSYKVYAADFVTTTDGTGVVHTAVMYGEEDYQLGEKIGLPKFHTVDDAGNFVDAVKNFSGLYVKSPETEQKIFEYLKANNNLIEVEQYEHEYPFCWRCDTPLLYYARDSWFIGMSKLRDKLQANNEQVNWYPGYIKHGRFGEWLREAKDWAVSRERYWGTPLPIWECDKCGKYQVVGSIAELKQNTNRFFFGRHGQAKNNLLGIHSNYPEKDVYDLTEEGIGMVQAMAAKIKTEGGVDLIIASDILRTKHTAEILAKELGVDLEFDERLREYDIGVYNGSSFDEFHQKFTDQNRWTIAPEGGETFEQLQKRVLNFIEDTNKKYNNKRILVVTHADAIWLLSNFFMNTSRYPNWAEFIELEVSIPDVHRPYIDDVVLKCPDCGSEAHRTTSVMDVWFDSGAMPYAQWHYPFENKTLIDQGQQFPADYISEAIDQTRGWFYTLMSIATLLDLGTPYKNVINLGHIQDKHGKKMSKSKGNVVDPWAIMNKQGVDALRWYMYSVNQPGETKLFDESDVDLIVRRQFLTLWNVLSFLVTYASHDNWDPEVAVKVEVSHIMDRWIEARTQKLVNEVTQNLEQYNTYSSAKAIEVFIDELSTWYVRRSRDRKGPEVYQTLFSALYKLALVMAPFTPFLSESLWQVLNKDGAETSVHLADWPATTTLSKEQEEVLTMMEVVRDVVTAGHAQRKAKEIKIRQPLGELRYWSKSTGRLHQEFESILLDELNFKTIKYIDEAEGDLKVEIDTEITPALKVEGLARDLERAVQEMRKTSGLKVGEKVILAYDTSEEELIKALNLFDKKKTFVTDIVAKPAAGPETEIDKKKIKLGLEKA